LPRLLPCCSYCMPPPCCKRRRTSALDSRSACRIGSGTLEEGTSCRLQKYLRRVRKCSVALCKQTPVSCPTLHTSYSTGTGHPAPWPPDASLDPRTCACSSAPPPPMLWQGSHGALLTRKWAEESGRHTGGCRCCSCSLCKAGYPGCCKRSQLPFQPLGSTAQHPAPPQCCLQEAATELPGCRWSCCNYHRARRPAVATHCHCLHGCTPLQ